jgi:UDP-N-acetylmuramoyl-tripeptide--D-alanyl-D-alanine ligase
MRELGKESASFHAELAEPLKAAKVDFAVLVGDEMEPLAKALGGHIKLAHVPDAAAAIGIARDSVGAGDAVLVKGSNSIGLAALVEALSDCSRPSGRSEGQPQTAANGLGTGSN